MKLSFETKTSSFGDKVLVTMFDNGKKVASAWKVTEGSNYLNLQDLKDQMKLNYLLDNQSDEEEGE